MTAKEARGVAVAFNSAKNDIIYKNLQEAIQQDASEGRFYTTINIPDYIIETDDNGVAYYIAIGDRLDKAVLTLKSDGFTQNPKDAGNWTGGKVGVGINKGTKYGIASNSYPNLDIKNLTLDQAKAIYRRDYWNKAKCDDLPDGLRFHVFDVAVNSGVSRGIKTLQQAVSVSVDGIVGPKTIAAAKSQNESDILLKFYAFRTEFYTSLSTFVS